MGLGGNHFMICERYYSRQGFMAGAGVGGPRPETRPRVNLGIVRAQYIYSGLSLRVQSSRNTKIATVQAFSVPRSDQFY